MYRQARKTFPREKTSPLRSEENASRWNTRLALPKEKPALSESRAIRHRVHTVPRRPRRDIRHTRGTGGTRTIRSLPARSAQETRGKKKREERKSRLGNRINPRKQRRKKNPIHTKENPVTPPESLENEFGNREENLTNQIDTPEYRPNPLSPLSGNIWCETYVRTPIGEPNPGFHAASFGCNRRE